MTVSVLGPAVRPSVHWPTGIGPVPVTEELTAEGDGTWLGTLRGKAVLASETCALDMIGAQFVRVNQVKFGVAYTMSHDRTADVFGIFGVPTLECDGKQYWGQDALPMLRAALLGDPWFDGPAWDAEGAPRAGVRRAAQP